MGARLLTFLLWCEMSKSVSKPTEYSVTFIGFGCSTKVVILTPIKLCFWSLRCLIQDHQQNWHKHKQTLESVKYINTKFPVNLVL